METFEKVPDTLEELEEGVIGSAYSIGRLRLLGYQKDWTSGKRDTHSEENIDTDED